MDGVQNMPFGTGPKGSKKQCAWTVPGQPVDHQVRTQNFCAGQDPAGIFFQRGDEKGLLFIEGGKVCPFQNMQKLKFYALYVLPVQVADCAEHTFCILAGKPKDYMRDYFDAPFSESSYRLLIDRKGIAPGEGRPPYLRVRSEVPALPILV